MKMLLLTMMVLAMTAAALQAKTKKLWERKISTSNLVCVPRS